MKETSGTASSCFQYTPVLFDLEEDLLNVRKSGDVSNYGQAYESRHDLPEAQNDAMPNWTIDHWRRAPRHGAVDDHRRDPQR
jgi:hypothetical protein